MLTASKNNVFAEREVDFSCVLYVYKSRNGSWRGFAHPYDVTIEAPTKVKAMSSLKEMVKEYEAGLKKYNYPARLAKRVLSDSEDSERFNALAFNAIVLRKQVRGIDYYAEAKKIFA